MVFYVITFIFDALDVLYFSKRPAQDCQLNSVE